MQRPGGESRRESGAPFHFVASQTEEQRPNSSRRASPCKRPRSGSASARSAQEQPRLPVLRTRGAQGSPSKHRGKAVTRPGRRLAASISLRAHDGQNSPPPPPARLHKLRPPTPNLRMPADPIQTPRPTTPRPSASERVDLDGGSGSNDSRDCSARNKLGRRYRNIDGHELNRNVRRRISLGAEGAGNESPDAHGLSQQDVIQSEVCKPMTPAHDSSDDVSSTKQCLPRALSQVPLASLSSAWQYPTCSQSEAGQASLTAHRQANACVEKAVSEGDSIEDYPFGICEDMVNGSGERESVERQGCEGSSSRESPDTPVSAVIAQNSSDEAAMAQGSGSCSQRSVGVFSGQPPLTLDASSTGGSHLDEDCRGDAKRRPTSQDRPQTPQASTRADEAASVRDSDVPLAAQSDSGRENENGCVNEGMCGPASANIRMLTVDSLGASVSSSDCVSNERCPAVVTHSMTAQDASMPDTSLTTDKVTPTLQIMCKRNAEVAATSGCDCSEERSEVLSAHSVDQACVGSDTRSASSHGSSAHRWVRSGSDTKRLRRTSGGSVTDATHSYTWCTDSCRYEGNREVHCARDVRFARSAREYWIEERAVDVCVLVWGYNEGGESVSDTDEEVVEWRSRLRAGVTSTSGLEVRARRWCVGEGADSELELVSSSVGDSDSECEARVRGGREGEIWGALAYTAPEITIRLDSSESSHTSYD